MKENPGIEYANAGPAICVVTGHIDNLFVSATNGRILSDHPSTGAPVGRRFVDSIYPFHTGQWAGIAGRLLVLLQGIWLIAMIILGLQLWRTRHTC